VRRIGINAFGYGGTVAHAILESAESMVPKSYHNHTHSRRFTALPLYKGLNPEKDKGRLPRLLLFSAHDEATLQNNIADYSCHCHMMDNPVDLSYTLGLRRTHLPYRAFAVTRFKNFSQDIEAASTTVTKESGIVQVGFVFTGKYILP
jgi:acyl transferase domain-containing protein